MKRLIPAAVILLIITVACALSTASVSNTVKSAKKEIEECRSLYNTGEYRKAYEQAENFRIKWKKTSSAMSAYSNHCPLDDIKVLAAILPESVKAKNTFEVNSAVSRIDAALDTVLREQTFTFESLY